MLAGLRKVEGMLLDPVSEKPRQPEYCRNEYLSRKPEYFVAGGLCTYLGCVPTFRPDVAPPDIGPKWESGYYCPCRGSLFDLAGRVCQQLTAPLYLVIPPYYYSGETTVTVGLDEKTVYLAQRALQPWMPFLKDLPAADRQTRLAQATAIPRFGGLALSLAKDSSTGCAVRHCPPDNRGEIRTISLTRM